MSVSTNERVPPRIPLEVAGVQVNFCENPSCSNFGVPASAEKQPKGPGEAGVEWGAVCAFPAPKTGCEMARENRLPSRPVVRQLIH
jgi:hypothetical protein